MFRLLLFILMSSVGIFNFNLEVSSDFYKIKDFRISEIKLPLFSSQGDFVVLTDEEGGVDDYSGEVSIEDYGEDTNAIYDSSEQFDPTEYSSSVGDMGRLVIPSLDVNVALYCGTESDGTVGDYAQRLANAQDSAAVILGPGNLIIADHWNQGFDNIKRAIIGETLAYIVYGDGSYSTYRCVGVDSNGINDGQTVWTSSGIDIYYGYYEYLTTYTCNENWQHVTIVSWEEIG